jgi:hypothetical protein
MLAALHLTGTGDQSERQIIAEADRPYLDDAVRLSHRNPT